MKKLFALIAVLALTATMTFATVNDNTALSGKTANGVFNAAVINALTVVKTHDGDDFGVFAVSADPYNVTGYVSFTVTGEPSAAFYYVITSAYTGTGTATIVTDAPTGEQTSALGILGTKVITVNATTLTASARGSVVLTETITVSYNTPV
jgi:hypothetical protein